MKAQSQSLPGRTKKHHETPHLGQLSGLKSRTGYLRIQTRCISANPQYTEYVSISLISYVAIPYNVTLSSVNPSHVTKDT